MLAACATASTEEFSMLSPMVIVPENSVKLPRTLEATRWRAMKSRFECVGSTVYTPGGGRVVMDVSLLCQHCLCPTSVLAYAITCQAVTFLATNGILAP